MTTVGPPRFLPLGPLPPPSCPTSVGPKSPPLGLSLWKEQGHRLSSPVLLRTVGFQELVPSPEGDVSCARAGSRGQRARVRFVGMLGLTPPPSSESTLSLLRVHRPFPAPTHLTGPPPLPLTQTPEAPSLPVLSQNLPPGQHLLFNPLTWAPRPPPALKRPQC